MTRSSPFWLEFLCTLPKSLFSSKPLLPTLRPTCCSRPLPARLSDAGLPPALPATQSSVSHHLDPALTTRQKLLSQRSLGTEMPDQWHFLSTPLPQPLCVIRH